MKKILLSAMFLISISIVNAQNSPVPTGYKLEKNDDYKKYQNDILKTIDYLENTPINTQKENRLKAKDFLMEWITGSPDVTIVLSSNIVIFADRNAELLVAFMGGYARYAIQHPEDKETLKGNVAGLKSVIKVYKMGNGIKDDDKVNKLVKTDAKGELEKWAKEQLAKDAKK